MSSTPEISTTCHSDVLGPRGACLGAPEAPVARLLWPWSRCDDNKKHKSVTSYSPARKARAASTPSEFLCLDARDGACCKLATSERRALDGPPEFPMAPRARGDGWGERGGPM